MSTLGDESGDPGARSLLSVVIGMRMDSVGEVDKFMFVIECVQDGRCAVSKVRGTSATTVVLISPHKALAR